jgi:hypothetical protein
MKKMIGGLAVGLLLMSVPVMAADSQSARFPRTQKTGGLPSFGQAVDKPMSPLVELSERAMKRAGAGGAIASMRSARKIVDTKNDLDSNSRPSDSPVLEPDPASAGMDGSQPVGRCA